MKACCKQHTESRDCGANLRWELYKRLWEQLVQTVGRQLPDLRAGLYIVRCLLVVNREASCVCARPGLPPI